MKNKLMMVVVLSLMMLFMMASFVFAGINLESTGKDESETYYSFNGVNIDKSSALGLKITEIENNNYPYALQISDTNRKVLSWVEIDKSSDDVKFCFDTYTMYLYNNSLIDYTYNSYVYYADNTLEKIHKDAVILVAGSTPPTDSMQYSTWDFVYWNVDLYYWNDFITVQYDSLEQSIFIVDKTIEGLQPFNDYATTLVNNGDDNYTYVVKKVEVEVAEGYNFIYRILYPSENDWSQILNYNLTTDSVYLDNYVEDTQDSSSFYPLFYESPRDTVDYHYLNPNNVDIWFPSGYDVTAVTVTDITADYINASGDSFISVLDINGNNLAEIDKFVDDQYTNVEQMVISLKVPDTTAISVAEDVINYLHVGSDTGWTVSSSALSTDGSWVTGTVTINYNVWLNNRYSLEFSYKQGSDVTKYLYDYVIMSVYQDDYYGDFDADQTITLTNKSWLEIMVSPLDSAKQMLETLFLKVNVINMIMPMWVPPEITAMLSGVIAIFILLAAIRLFKP